MPPRGPSVECVWDGLGCGGRYTARGLCHRHYRAALRSGAIQSQRGTPAERFWRKVDRNGPIPEYRPELGPCWLWTATLDGHGYGYFDGHPAHRWAWQEAHGSIAPELSDMDHLCRVPRCVRPSHLEPVTHAENIRRGAGGFLGELRVARRRPSGETHGTPILTEAEVRYIRSSDLSGNWLAECMGVAPLTISNARRGRTWKHVA